MNWVSAAMMFALIWWVMLFVVLPIGVRGQYETDDVTWGTDPGAPAQSRMVRRVVATTVLAALVWAGLYAAIDRGLITMETFDFLPGPKAPR